MSNTHRRRDATVELSRVGVGVGGVYWALLYSYGSACYGAIMSSFSRSIATARIIMSCSCNVHVRCGMMRLDLAYTGYNSETGASKSTVSDAKSATEILGWDKTKEVGGGQSLNFVS